MLIGPWFEHITERIGLVSRVVCSKLQYAISNSVLQESLQTYGRSVLFYVLRQMMGNCTTKKKKNQEQKRMMIVLFSEIDPAKLPCDISLRSGSNAQ